MVGLLKPAPHAERVPKEQTDRCYRRLRRQVFAGIFVGYAAYRTQNGRRTVGVTERSGSDFQYFYSKSSAIGS